MLSLLLLPQLLLLLRHNIDQVGASDGSTLNHLDSTADWSTTLIGRALLLEAQPLDGLVQHMLLRGDKAWSFAGDRTIHNCSRCLSAAPGDESSKASSGFP